MNELLNNHRTTINYIEALGYKVDIDEVVELGLEQLKAKVDKQRDLQRYIAEMSKPKQDKKPSLDVAIRNCINDTDVRTWAELVEQLIEDYPSLANVKPATQPAISNHKYYYEDKLVRQATQGQYGISKVGNITEA